MDTLNPGDAASVSLSVIGSVLHFSFGIPRGNDGASATPVTSYLVDATNTLDPGTAAAAQVSFDGNNVRFIFDIPRSFDGQPGGDGQPGEVTNADLSSAIDGTSANTNAVDTLDTAPSDPPTFADYEALRAAFNALVLAARR